MKMTGLEWTYLQRIALDHPYFDAHELPLTEKEAKAIVEANISMTGREFVDSVYAKLGMTRPKEEKKRFAKLRGVGELLAVPPIRRIAIAVLVVVLMAVFFAATPTGRAIAESVIQYIAMLFRDGRVVVNRNDNEIQIMEPSDTMPDSEEDIILEQEINSEVSIDTIEEFTTAMGVRPTVLPFPHTKLKYDYDEFDGYLKLHAEYETSKGVIITDQYWNVLDLEFSTGTGFAVYDMDPSVYYSFDDDGTINIVRIDEDTVIAIIAENSYTVDEIISLLIVE